MLSLRQRVIGSAVIAAVLYVAPPHSSAYSQMTGSTTYGSEEDSNWENRSSENNPMWGEAGREILGNINPYSPLIKGAEFFSGIYGKFKEKTGNITGIGRTTEEE